MIDYIPYIWILFGFLLIGSELLIPGLVIFFFGAGALLTGLLTAVVPLLKSNLVVQILIWLISSSLSLFTLRKYFSRIFKGRVLKKDEQDEFVGRRVNVIEAIRPDQPGRVSFQGTSWTAASYSETFKPGDTVEILKKENLTFIVTKSIMGNNTE